VYDVRVCFCVLGGGGEIVVCVLVGVSNYLLLLLERGYVFDRSCSNLDKIWRIQTAYNNGETDGGGGVYIAYTLEHKHTHTHTKT